MTTPTTLEERFTDLYNYSNTYPTVEDRKRYEEDKREMWEFFQKEIALDRAIRDRELREKIEGKLYTEEEVERQEENSEWNCYSKGTKNDVLHEVLALLAESK